MLNSNDSYLYKSESSARGCHLYIKIFRLGFGEIFRYGMVWYDTRRNNEATESIP